jgi:hypothetical protein
MQIEKTRTLFGSLYVKGFSILVAYDSDFVFVKKSPIRHPFFDPLQLIKTP